VEEALPTYKFSYLNSETPILSRVYPARSFGKDFIRFYGKHLISSLGGSMSSQAQSTDGDINELRIGEDRCDRAALNEQDISPNAWAPIGCYASPTHPAGKVNVLERVVPGTARKDASMIQTTLLDEPEF